MTTTCLDLQPHKLASLLPAVTESQYADLLDSVRANGLLVPIVLFEGRILDGVHRHRACIEAAAEIRTVEYTGQCGSPDLFVAEINLKRRHLSKQQRDELILKLLPAAEKRAEDRQVETRAKPGESANRRSAPATNVAGATHKAAAEVAKAVGVVSRTVERVKAKQQGKIPAQKPSTAAAARPMPVSPESRPWFADAAGRLREWLRDFNIPEFRDERKLIKEAITSLDRRQNSAA